MSSLSEKFEGAEVICGVYDPKAAAFTGDDVEAHSAEVFKTPEVICGVYDAKPAFSGEDKDLV